MRSKISPLRAIKKYCIECGDGTLAEVRRCPVEKCPLYPYRMGHKPKECNFTSDEVDTEKTPEKLRKKV